MQFDKLGVVRVIVIFKDEQGKYRWRVGETVAYRQGEQLFPSTVAAVDALGFALREGFSREYCAALAESVLDALID